MKITELEIKALLDFLQSAQGQILVRIVFVLIMAEGFRLLLRKFFDIIDVFTDVRKKAIEAITDFLAYLGNIAMSVLFTYAFIGPGDNVKQSIAVSIVYGLISILLHWSIITGKMKMIIKTIFKILTWWKKHGRG